MERYKNKYGRVNILLTEREERAVTLAIERATKAGFATITPTQALRSFIELGIQAFDATRKERVALK